jgi:integrase
MGHVVKTPAGTFRANWRDVAGKQKAKTFRTKKEASAFLAEMEATVNRGTYVDPHAGRIRFQEYAVRWMGSRVLRARSTERLASIMRTHVMPKWNVWPLGQIQHMDVQEWVRELTTRLAPGTVIKCYGALSMVLRSAVRARIIPTDPSEGITVPSAYARRAEVTTISQTDFLGRLLPAIPEEHRALVCTAAGAGLRWGECAGLAWGSVDLNRDVLRVVQVAEETAGTVVIRPYPKTRAGIRSVPMAPFLVAELRARLGRLDVEPDFRDLVFGARTGSALRRSNFRRQVWRPALARAGLLGQVAELGPDNWRAIWRDLDGIEWRKEFTTERDAVAYLAETALGGLRFHDLRHSYATWLVSAGLPVNVIQRAMGHQSPTTTLAVYTHSPDDYGDRIRDAFSDGHGA